MSSPKSSFRIDVVDLLHRPGEMREREFEAAAGEDWRNAVIAVPKGTPVKVHARLESLHEGILVTATAETIAVGECVRCLQALEELIKVEIQEVFAYSLDDAFDYSIRDAQLDLEEAVRDEVVLALPFQPVCEPDCEGLCPLCGIRLLDEPNHEHEAAIDPRWSALADLKGNPEQIGTVESSAQKEER